MVVYSYEKVEATVSFTTLKPNAPVPYLAIEKLRIRPQAESVSNLVYPIPFAESY